MRKAFFVAVVLMGSGVCSATFAATPDGCRAIFAGCMKACSTNERCQSNCYEGVGLCLMFARQGNKPFFRDAATAAGPFSAPAVSSGVKNVNPGVATTTTANIGTVGTQAINAGAAVTATTGITASTPGKPIATFSNGISAHLPVAQPARGNLRAQ